MCKRQRYFEDIEIGERWDVGDYEMTAERIKSFAAEFDPLPMHTDEAAAEKTRFNGLLASGAHTIAAWARLRAQTTADHAEIAGARIDVYLTRPVRPGHKLRLQRECVEKLRHPKGEPGGFIVFSDRVVTQDGELVMRLRNTTLYDGRPS